MIANLPFYLTLNCIVHGDTDHLIEFLGYDVSKDEIIFRSTCQIHYKEAVERNYPQCYCREHKCTLAEWNTIIPLEDRPCAN